jgi:hypothetical protein
LDPAWAYCLVFAWQESRLRPVRQVQKCGVRRMPRSCGSTRSCCSRGASRPLSRSNRKPCTHGSLSTLPPRTFRPSPTVLVRSPAAADPPSSGKAHPAQKRRNRPQRKSPEVHTPQPTAHPNLRLHPLSLGRPSSTLPCGQRGIGMRPLNDLHPKMTSQRGAPYPPETLPFQRC